MVGIPVTTLESIISLTQRKAVGCLYPDFLVARLAHIQLAHTIVYKRQ